MSFRRLLPAVFLVFSFNGAAQNRFEKEMMRDIATLQMEVRELQRTVNEKLTELTVLMQQTLERTNTANTAVAVLDKGVQDRLRDQERTLRDPVAAVGAKVDQMSNEFRFVRESIADVNARMRKLEAQMVDVGNAVKTLQAPPAPPPLGSPGGGPPPGVSADSLYNSAYSDMTGGNTDLALQEFQDYIRFFETTDRAPSAQFYIGQIYYNKSQWDPALQAFDLVLEKYPDNSKTPDAMYMKGRTLLRLEQRTAAAQEFREVIKRFPNSDVAAKARGELKSLGLPISEGKKRR